METQTDSEAQYQKLVFRVPVELHEQIKAAADDDDRSMASWIRRVLEDRLNGTREIQT